MTRTPSLHTTSVPICGQLRNTMDDFIADIDK